MYSQISYRSLAMPGSPCTPQNKITSHLLTTSGGKYCVNITNFNWLLTIRDYTYYYYYKFENELICCPIVVVILSAITDLLPTKVPIER